MGKNAFESRPRRGTAPTSSGSSVTGVTDHAYDWDFPRQILPCGRSKRRRPWVKPGDTTVGAGLSTEVTDRKAAVEALELSPACAGRRGSTAPYDESRSFLEVLASGGTSRAGRSRLRPRRGRCSQQPHREGRPRKEPLPVPLARTSVFGGGATLRSRLPGSPSGSTGRSAAPRPGCGPGHDQADRVRRRSLGRGAWCSQRPVTERSRGHVGRVLKYREDAERVARGPCRAAVRPSARDQWHVRPVPPEGGGGMTERAREVQVARRR